MIEVLLITAAATAALLVGRALLRPPPRRVAASYGGRDPVSGVSITNGVATSPRGASYRFTAEDRLWLGLAINGEAGTHVDGGKAVAWAMINNYLTTGPGGGPRTARLPTFTHLLRAYCQPLSAVWTDPNSQQCQRQPNLCRPQDIARRRGHQSTPWESLPGSVRATVDAFFAGQVANPVPGATGWDNRPWASDGVNIGGNWFGSRRG